MAQDTPIIPRLAVKDKGYRIQPGGTLSLKERLVSQNGKFTLTLQADGNLVLKNDSDWVLWGANEHWEANEHWGDNEQRRFQPGYSAEMEDDGNFTLYDINRKKIWKSDSNKPENKNGILILQDDGDVVIDCGTHIAWRMGTKPLERLEAGSTLTPHQYIQSPNGMNRFVMQLGGRMALFEGGTETWSVSIENGSSLHLGEDDNLSLLMARSYDDIKWASGTQRREKGGKAILTVRDDGAIVLTSDGLIIWSNKAELIQPFEMVDLKPADEGVDRLNRGEYLLLGQSLVSPNGKFSAIFRKDTGTLDVVRNSNGLTIRSTGTAYGGATKLCRSWGGAVLAYGPKSSVVWKFDSDLSGPLVLENDGIMLLGHWNTDSHLPSVVGPLRWLEPTQSLAIDETLRSQNGQYIMGFTEYGTLYIQEQSGATTHYYLSDKPLEGCVILTCYSADYDRKIGVKLKDVYGETVISVEAPLGTRGAGYRFAIDNDALFGFQDNNSVRIWNCTSLQTGAAPTRPYKSVGHSLLATGKHELLPGQGISSPDGRHYFGFGIDGNLALVSGGNPWWESKKKSEKPGKTVLERDGKLVCYDSSSVAYWSSMDEGVYKIDQSLPIELAMQNDRNCVLYNSLNHDHVNSRWTTATHE